MLLRITVRFKSQRYNNYKIILKNSTKKVLWNYGLLMPRKLLKVKIPLVDWHRHIFFFKLSSHTIVPYCLVPYCLVPFSNENPLYTFFGKSVTTFSQMYIGLFKMCLPVYVFSVALKFSCTKLKKLKKHLSYLSLGTKFRENNNN